MEPTGGAAIQKERPIAETRSVYARASVEVLYDYLRYDAFKSYSTQELEAFFKVLVYIPCKEPVVLQQIELYASKGDMKGCLNAIQQYSKKQEFDNQKLVKNMDELIATYMQESDRNVSFVLLRKLMFFPVTESEESHELYRGFIKYYKTLQTKEDKLQTLGDVFYDSYNV